MKWRLSILSNGEDPIIKYDIVVIYDIITIQYDVSIIQFYYILNLNK
jgi:hypothetical protein